MAHNAGTMQNWNGAAGLPDRHPRPDTAGKTAEQYTYEAMRMQQAQYKGTPPPKLVKWVGDAALAVLPINRFWCAVGLTSGLLVAGNLAAVATGKTLLGKEVKLESVPTIMQKLHKIVPYVEGNTKRNNWVKYAQWGVYSLGGFIGIKIGTEHAYRKVHKKNKDPHHLEDYLSRVSMHQGDTWSWMAASGGIFGSSSGLFLVPVPGLNYGVGLAARTTSMQDRNIMIGGPGKYLSGSSTTSYLRLREGLHYMCHYAVGNKAENPAQIEYLAYTLLGPIFKDQLTAEHIQEFAEAVHAVRDHYWQPGGIPAEKRAEAVQTMKEVFTGAGLEVLLINMGLNPGTIKFEKLNGLVGKMGNIGAHKKIDAEEKHYHETLRSHLAKYVEQGLVTKERADWVISGMELASKNKVLPKEPDECPNPSVFRDNTVIHALSDEKSPPQQVEFGPQAKVSIGAKGLRTNVKDLIRTAERDKGDWRETLLQRKQDTASPFLIE